MFWNKNKKTTENRRNSELLLYIGPFGWQALLINTQKNISAIFSGELSSESAASTEHATALIAAAISSCHFSKKQGGNDKIVNLLELAESISVIISIGSIFFADSMTNNLHSASPARLREYGSVLNGGAETSFCFSRFGKNEGVEVYGFLPITVLKAILRPFGEYALKIRQIIPLEQLLLLRSQQTRLYGGVILGDVFTVIVTANWDNATATIRTLSSGIMHPIRKMALAAAVPIEEVESALRMRDMTTKLAGRNDSTGLDASTRILYEFLVDTVSVIEQTRSFFAVQRASGRIHSFELFGGIRQIKGLDSALNIRLQTNGCVGDSNYNLSITDMYAQAKQLSECNLLKGTSVPLLQFGKKQFAFEQERFRLAMKPEVHNVSNGRYRSGQISRKRKSNTHQRGIKWVYEFFKKTSSAPYRDGENKIEGSYQRERIYYAWLTVLILLILYKGYDMYDTEKNSIIRKIREYDSLLNDYTMLRNKTGNYLKDIRHSSKPDDVNKILWTEKFLAIGKHIDQSLWLTDVYIKTERKILNGIDTTIPVLTIEGSALPSTEGHIDRIAKFIEKLKTDDTMFMNDFREIIFKGAEREGGEGYSVIKFKIEAICDINKIVSNQQDTNSYTEKSFDQLIKEKSDSHYKIIEEASNIK